MSTVKNIAILGSTGSIGRSALEVIRSLDGFNVFGISGHSQTDRLAEQAREFQPRYVVATDDEAAGKLNLDDLDGTTVLTGDQALEQLASDPEVDIVLAAIVGIAGLASTWAAVQSGKTVALANKESLVVAGELMTQMAQSTGATILPVDSEHSAVFQCLTSGSKSEVERIILTASGGPFRDFNQEELESATVEQALSHPTWDMGPKITIDSATMMNKALEIIEARWLFGLTHDKIDVVIHPQSIVHSLVEFVDGSIVGQFSPPDMKLPIQLALTWPERLPGVASRLDFNQAVRLEFTPPDRDRFPSLELGAEVARFGGSSGAVLNAANESAVDAFLRHEINFTDIVTACREILDHHHYEPHPTMEQLLAADRWAKQEMSKWISA